MQLSELNIWGTALLIVLTVMAMTLLWFTDRRMLNRVGRVLFIGIVQTALIAVYLWALMRLQSIWIDLLWLVLMCGAMAWIVGKKTMKSLPRLTLPLSGALLVGCGLTTAVLSWALPGRLFVPVAAVLLSLLYVPISSGIGAYAGSIVHTLDHRRYLLANGATRIESIIPSVQRALQGAIIPILRQLASPLFLAMPLLLGGMLLGGIQPLPAVVVTLLFIAALLVSSILSTLLTIVFLELLRSTKFGKKKNNVNRALLG